MGEMPEERGTEDVRFDNSARASSKYRYRHSSLGSSPDTEGGSTKATTQPRSTPESTMTDDSDGVKKETTGNVDSEPKTGRGSSTAKSSRRSPPLFDHYPSATEEATKTFLVIGDSSYTSKYLGDSGQDEAMSCDCRPSWGELSFEHILHRGDISNSS